MPLSCPFEVGAVGVGFDVGIQVATGSDRRECLAWIQTRDGGGDAAGRGGGAECSAAAATPGQGCVGSVSGRS